MTSSSNGGNGQWRIWAIVAGAALNMVVLVGVGIVGYMWVTHSRSIERATESALEAHAKLAAAHTAAAVNDEQLRQLDRRLSSIEGTMEALKTGQMQTNDRLASISGRVDGIAATTSKHASQDSDLAVQIARAILDQQQMLAALGVTPSKIVGRDHARPETEK